MKFILSSLLVFLCVFAKAQTAPPMKVGGPQGIDATRLLSREWLSVPIYIDTPVAPLTGGGWPGAAYVIQATKNYRDATIEEWLKWAEAGGLTQLDSIRWQDQEGTVYFLPKGIDTSQVLDYLLYGDTSVWHYTGKNWRRVGGNAEFYFDYLLDGGYVTQVAPASSRQFTISPSDYYLGGVRYKYDTTFRIQAPSKVADSTGRIDVIFLSTTGPRLIKGNASRIPVKPQVRSGMIELASIYFRPFDTIPNVVNGAGKGVSSIYRIAGRDSIYYTIDTLTFAIKDSIGISRTDTTAMLNPYKFTADNGLTKDSTVFRLGGSLNQNTNINLNTRRLTIIGGTDTTRFFANGRVSIGGTPDSTFMLNVNGNTRVKGVLNFEPTQNTNQIRITSGNGPVGGNSTSQRLIAIGPFAAQALTSSGGESLVAIGQNAGGQTTSGGRYSVMIGRAAGAGITTGEFNTIIASGDAQNLPSNTSNAIHLVAGAGYEFNNADTTLLGLTGRYAFIGGGFNQANYINDFYLGAGHRVRQPSLAHLNLYAPSGLKADTIGSNFTINAGRGTGTGAGGSVVFRTSSPTTSGTTLQTLTERARISPAGNLLVGTTIDPGFKVNVAGVINTNSDFRASGVGDSESVRINGSNGGSVIFYNSGLTPVSTIHEDSINYVFPNNNNPFTATIQVKDNLINTTNSGNIRIIPAQTQAGFGNIILAHDGTKSKGSVLIGKSTQSVADTAYKLDVNGNVRLNGWVDDTNVPGNSGNWGKNVGTGIYFANTVSDVGLKVGAGVDGTSRFILKNNGNIITSGVNNFGIGTITPTAKLHVSNNTDSTCFKVEDRFNRDSATLVDQTPFIIHNNGDVSVGTAIDDTSSKVNIVSTTKGFLQPRMTNTQKNAITTPATGLQVFSTTDSANYVYRGTGGGWQKIANEISGSNTLDFGSTSHGTSSDITFTVTGAAEGDVVALGIPNSAIVANGSFIAWVSAANTITVRFNNYASSGSSDPGSGLFKVKVFK